MSDPAQKLDLDYTLDDRYARSEGRIYLNGVQALVRLPLLQRQMDLARGLNTAGFISGYRGSPLGGLDLQLWRAKSYLQDNHIQFVPGLNEDLAATTVWGSQQVNLWPGALYDGVFSMWYGKGPGVDRSGDVFKHANAAGTSKHGGVLVLAGDDHACRSSTLPHQSEHEFISAIMPILNPAGVQDILELGLYGWALSRYTGRWVGFKTIAETVESSASIDIDPHQLNIVLPEDFAMPPGGLNIRWPDDPMSQEERLHRYALFAAQAFCRANGLNKTVIESPTPRLGILTTGKSYLDVLQALEYLGIDHKMAADIGITVHKLAMTWPMEPVGLKQFAENLEDLIVVEEKRSFVERQLKELMYNWEKRPTVIGKYDEEGNWVLPSVAELTPAMIARVIASRLERFFTSDRIKERLAFIEQKEKELSRPRVDFKRAPHFCSGCPHNTSTQVPEGSRAMAGIGCHYMTVWMDRRTETFTQMGGEGTPWIGQSPFTDTKHVFVNLGDGTYFHSGSLAVRACQAAGVNVTFKILYNDAVAMTGGQHVDGVLTVPDLIQQVRAEGVTRIHLVSDTPEKWQESHAVPSSVKIHHRDEMDALQKDLRESEGVSVLVYEQTCAAEKRRRRKRGLMPDPAKRAFIHAGLCEGCGDCGVKSNCLSLLPLETELGRKRLVDQSSCNKDFSCVNGFCPSFVTVHGGELKKRAGSLHKPPVDDLPEPALAELDKAYNILLTGVGGTGVVTIAALIGMAAHLEGKGVTVLDQTGLAQKGGAVTSHIRIAAEPSAIHAVRIAAGEADLVLGCDMVVAGEAQTLSKMCKGKTRAIVNDNEAMPGTFTRQPGLLFPQSDIRDAIGDAVGEDAVEFFEATRLATDLMGDSIATNLFMVGYAWQKGLIPVSREALERAIELNGVSIPANLAAFSWGRVAAHDLSLARQFADEQHDPLAQKLSQSLEDVIEDRRQRLVEYQNESYSKRYTGVLARFIQMEQLLALEKGSLADIVARNYYKLLAYKDEYEVARQLSSKDFKNRLQDTFSGDFKLHYYLAPPMLAKKDPETGHLVKMEFGAWMGPVFKLLAKMKFLRGSWLDPFAMSADRKLDRQLLADYESLLEKVLTLKDEEKIAIARELLALPETVSGYGHIREESASKMEINRRLLMDKLEMSAGFEKAA